MVQDCCKICIHSTDYPISGSLGTFCTDNPFFISIFDQFLQVQSQFLIPFPKIGSLSVEESGKQPPVARRLCQVSYLSYFQITVRSSSYDFTFNTFASNGIIMISIEKVRKSNYEQKLAMLDHSFPTGVQKFVYLFILTNDKCATHSVQGL